MSSLCDEFLMTEGSEERAEILLLLHCASLETWLRNAVKYYLMDHVPFLFLAKSP